MFFIGPSGMKFVSAGDLASESFDKNDFTQDNAWHELDVSSAVPAGTALVVWRIIATCATAGFLAKIRPNGYTNEKNMLDLMVIVANKNVCETFAMVLPADHKLEYKFSNVAWGTIFLTPVGWFV